jgi:hypothetical protein
MAPWNVGIAVPSGVVIVDIDPRNGGVDTYSKIVAEHGEDWMRSLTVHTGSDGCQVYFRCEPDHRFPMNLDGHFGSGIDLKQRGGYVLAPPSNHRSGGTYRWDRAEPNVLAPAPAWLTSLARVCTPGIDGVGVVPDVTELDDDLRARLDRAIAVIRPHYTRGRRHHLALAIGGYLRNRQQPALAAEYVVSQLPSSDPDGRVLDALWAFGEEIDRPLGADGIRSIAPALLEELDALGLDTLSMRLWSARLEARHTALVPREEPSIAVPPRAEGAGRRKNPSPWITRTLAQLASKGSAQ